MRSFILNTAAALLLISLLSGRANSNPAITEICIGPDTDANGEKLDIFKSRLLEGFTARESAELTFNPELVLSELPTFAEDHGTDQEEQRKAKREAVKPDVEEVRPEGEEASPGRSFTRLPTDAAEEDFEIYESPKEVVKEKIKKNLYILIDMRLCDDGAQRSCDNVRQHYPNYVPSRTRRHKGENLEPTDRDSQEREGRGIFGFSLMDIACCQISGKQGCCDNVDRFYKKLLGNRTEDSGNRNRRDVNGMEIQDEDAYFTFELKNLLNQCDTLANVTIPLAKDLLTKEPKTMKEVIEGLYEYHQSLKRVLQKQGEEKEPERSFFLDLLDSYGQHNVTDKNNRE